MGWKDADKKAVDTGGKFIKMKDDGDSCKGVLMGDPTCEDLIFEDGKTRAFTEEDEKAGKQSTPKFKFNLFTTEVNDKPLEKPEMKMLGVNATTYRFISNQRQKAGGDFGWRTVSITRNGKKGSTDTTYNVAVSDNELSEDLQKIAKKCKVHNLENESTSDFDESSSGGFDSYSQDKEEKADGPITKEQSSQLAEPYKKGGKLHDELQEFLTKFGIQRFKDLKASQYEGAMTYTKERLEPATETENDPFG